MQPEYDETNVTDNDINTNEHQCFKETSYGLQPRGRGGIGVNGEGGMVYSGRVSTISSRYIPV